MIMFGRIYLVTNKVNGKRYVGQTTQSIKRRWGHHLSATQCGKRNSLISSAIRKYGQECFDVSLLEECDDREGLNAAEVRWISEMASFGPLGYNLAAGGEGTSGHKMTAEFCRKLGERTKGRVFSPESRAKVSAGNTGKVRSEEFKRRVSKMFSGRPRSEEFKRKVSAIHRERGTRPSAAAIDAARKANTGRKLVGRALECLFRPVSINGVVYRSLTEAAEAAGVSYTTVSKRIQRGDPGYLSLAPVRPRAKRSPRSHAENAIGA